MNKEQTTRERKSIQFWWDSLPLKEKQALTKKYAEMTMVFHYYSFSYEDIKAIHTAEHPTAPTVKEDSSSEGKELRIVKWANDGCPPIDLNKNVSHVLALADGYDKLKADNKLLRDALQWMITMYQLSSDYKNLSPSWQQKTNEAIAVLGQTK